MTLATIACLAQDSVRVAKKDTTAVDYSKFIPTGVRFGPDLISIGKSQLQDELKGWEIQADVDFYRYFLVAEYGASALTQPLRNGLYTNDGTYFRVGVDVNFLYKDPVKNMFFIGSRFGRASYTDALAYNYQTLQFDPNAIVVQNSDVIATWVELTSGIKVRVWKFFWLGATARFKFGLDLDGNGNLRSYEVPGFGRNIAQTYWGFSYYALFRIPFVKETKAGKK